MSKPYFKIFCLPLCFLSLACCSNSANKKSPETNVSWTSVPSTTLKPGNTIKLVSYSDPRLTGRYRVSPNGFLHLPYAVSVKAIGVEHENLNKELKKAYSKYIISPRLKASVLSDNVYVAFYTPGAKLKNILVDKDAEFSDILKKIEYDSPSPKLPIRLKYATIEQNGIVNTFDIRNVQPKDLPQSWYGGEKIVLH